MTSDVAQKLRFVLLRPYDPTMVKGVEPQFSVLFVAGVDAIDDFVVSCSRNEAERFAKWTCRIVWFGYSTVFRVASNLRVLGKKIEAVFSEHLN
jgi:hypothetical protein